MTGATGSQSESRHLHHLSLVKTSSANVGRQIADMQRHNSCTRNAATVFP